MKELSEQLVDLLATRGEDNLEDTLHEAIAFLAHLMIKNDSEEALDSVITMAKNQIKIETGEMKKAKRYIVRTCTEEEGVKLYFYTTKKERDAKVEELDSEMDAVFTKNKESVYIDSKGRLLYLASATYNFNLNLWS